MYKDGILLEAGTGEVEILEFMVKGVHYAINVVKVKEILHIENIAKVPNSHPAVPGITLIRGEVITVVDMNFVVENKKVEDVTTQMILVCEFNRLKVAFAIDQVIGITRVGWNSIHKPDDLTSNSLVIGNINLNNRIVMMLDFEKIVMDISPSTGIAGQKMDDVKSNSGRKNLKVAIADDSPLIRQVLKDTLTGAGFTNLRFFDNGQEALDYFLGMVVVKKEAFKDEVDILITDIEMPRLDGHTLTRKIKEHSILRDLPVIIFSSLITSELKHKGEAVGANAQLSKPEVVKLISVIDSLLNK
jgi:two-component system chemotaxis response regulator CheV